MKEQELIRSSRGDEPRFELVPGIFAIMEGWLKECVKVVTVMAAFVDAMVLTCASSHVPACVPYVDR